jgi:hypothetical protein
LADLFWRFEEDDEAISSGRPSPPPHRDNRRTALQLVVLALVVAGLITFFTASPQATPENTPTPRIAVAADVLTGDLLTLQAPPPTAPVPGGLAPAPAETPLPTEIPALPVAVPTETGTPVLVDTPTLTPVPVQAQPTLPELPTMPPLAPSDTPPAEQPTSLAGSPPPTVNLTTIPAPPSPVLNPTEVPATPTVESSGPYPPPGTEATPGPTPTPGSSYP